jgi:hypothetical protein
MIRVPFCVRAVAVAAISVMPGGGAAFGAPATVDFNRDIRPLLSDTCFACHGPDAAAREADLRLDVEASAKAAREEGRVAVVPGNPDGSELIRRITHPDRTQRMPPAKSGKKLTGKDIALLRRWIEEGAPWSPAWAYVPPRRPPAPPAVDNPAWPANWIDNHVLARLSAEGLRPSPEADRVTLIRRLSVDLTGLPPSPDEVDAFTADSRPDAWERLVDRLLASPRFGERMAMHWLDLVRYADTVGYHGDQEQHISPYRDYVINAFNANLPFDQFTREQLAGDLPAPSKAEGLPQPSLDRRIATGYNRLLQTSHEGGVQKKEYLAIYAADRVRNLSAVWMGATMGCAQCHDHKYDPYTTRDFYSMQAFFADVDEARHLEKGGGADRTPTVREPELELPTEEQRARIAALEGRLKELQERRKGLTAAAGPPPAPAPGDAAKDVGAVTAKPAAPAPDEAAKALDKEIEAAAGELKAVRAGVRRTMITVAIPPRTIRILPRGNWLDDSGEVVEPAIPAFLGALDTGGRRPTRLDLAEWLTDARLGAGGLTARVTANRLWYLMFGRGLAPVLDDFGGQGQAPSHPELLDALAVEFVESGWDVKRMLKRLAMSRAYRQSSSATAAQLERDPLNQWFGRQSRFRFPAETVRDGALAAAGLLVETIGGGSVKPYQPAGYYRHLNFPEREYQAHTDERQWRRGVYMHWQRQFLHPMLKAFDAPSREECTAERPRSNTPLAALTLLNDPTFVEAARALAARVLREGGATDAGRLDDAFRRVVSRPAADGERAALGALLDQSRAYYAAHPGEADKLSAVGLSPVPEGIDRVELAAWTVAVRAILSQGEAVTRR